MFVSVNERNRQKSSGKSAAGTFPVNLRKYFEQLLNVRRRKVCKINET